MSDEQMVVGPVDGYKRWVLSQVWSEDRLEAVPQVVLYECLRCGATVMPLPRSFDLHNEWHAQ